MGNLILLLVIGYIIYRNKDRIMEFVSKIMARANPEFMAYLKDHGITNLNDTAAIAELNAEMSQPKILTDSDLGLQTEPKTEKPKPNASLNNLKRVSVLPKILSDSILQSWSCHLPGLYDKRNEFFSLVVDEFNNKKTGLDIAITALGSFGKKQDFLVVRFAGFYCIIGADTLGTDLIASWNLCDPKRIKENKAALESKINIKLIRMFTPRSELIKDIEVRSFASVTEDVANQAVDRLVIGTDIDKSKLNRKSSGTLGPL